VYGIGALTTHLNLGLRHVLPLYPFIYLLIGAAAQSFVEHATVARRIALGLLIVLALETLSVFPNYIAFFNLAARPYRLELLSDSNLDWGQDLPALADWQQRNPTAYPLYLAYFGTAPPWEYGLNYVPAQGGYFLERGDAQWPERPGGVVAVSALLLQGTGVPRNLQTYYAQFRTLRPREILGGSIYLYDVPQPPLPRPSH
jgi:hypothetical protein